MILCEIASALFVGWCVWCLWHYELAERRERDEAKKRDDARHPGF